MLTRREFLQTTILVALGTSAFAAEKDDVTTPRFSVTWAGGPTMVIRFGNLTILTDPMLGETFAMGDPNDPVDHEAIRAHRRLTPVAGIDLAAVNLVLLSHLHEDHFDQQAWTELSQALPVILPVADTTAVAAKGFQWLDGLTWGDVREFDAGTGRMRIIAMPAHHSRDPAIAKALGTGNGYWIEFSEGTWKRTMYWTGDTMPTDEVVNAVRSRGQPDLMVPDVGGVGATGPFGQISMRAADVIALTAAVGPKHVLPVHHSTYEFYREPIAELADRSKGQSYRLDLIQAGSTVVYR